MKTIFVVDDSLTNLVMAKNALENYYRVFTMTSAVKMFTLLERIISDLILLDIEMPDMDGFEALRCLKSNPVYTNIPVILLTSYTGNAIETRAFELGAVDFITKPFSASELRNRIETHLNIDELIPE
jgi:putative two-component system response regulator